MDPFEFEFEVDPETSYVPGKEQVSVSSVHVAGNQRMALVTLYREDDRVGGIRISPEDMDRLCEEWMDARRVCPLCHKPGMDVVEPTSYLECIETNWECYSCGGDSVLQITPGSVPWEDPLESTR